jgi:hypothetical protein
MGEYTDETDRIITEHLGKISLRKPSFTKLAREAGMDPGGNPEAAVRAAVVEGELMAGNTNKKGLKEQVRETSINKKT